jgi:AraC family transcriptional regulator
MAPQGKSSVKERRSTDAPVQEQSSRPAPWTIRRQLAAPGARYTESRFAALTPYPLHEHPAPGIALLLRGAIEMTYASGRRLAGDAGGDRVSAVVLPTGEAHRGRTGADGALVLFLEFSAHRMATMGPSAVELLGLPAQLRAPRLAMLGRGLERELAFAVDCDVASDVADDAAALALEGLTLEVLAALVRQRRNSATLGPPPAWLRRVRETLEDCYGEREIRIAALADVAGVDPAHLARAFRAHYGTTPGAYLRETRVRRAAEALSHSSTPIGEIALDAGFADQSHFTRHFRSAYGVTPRKWRALRTSRADQR